MKAVHFQGVNRTYAKDQPEYNPLPVMALPGPEGEVISCHELSPEEFEKVRQTKRIYLHQLTFGGKLQPIRLEVELEQYLVEHSEKPEEVQNENEVKLQLELKADRLFIDFGTRVQTLSFNRDQAIALANALLERAFTLPPTKKDEEN